MQCRRTYQSFVFSKIKQQAYGMESNKCGKHKQTKIAKSRQKRDKKSVKFNLGTIPAMKFGTTEQRKFFYNNQNIKSNINQLTEHF